MRLHRNLFGLVFVASALLSGTALAQTDLLLPSSPSANGSVPSGPPALPGEEENQRVMGQPINAAPIPDQNGQGMMVPPTPDAEDPAERMTLDQAGEYLDTITAQSVDRLEELSSVVIESDVAIDLETMIRSKRKIMMLGLLNEEAELAVSLWGTLYNNEHAQAWRERERMEEESRRESEAAATASRLEQAAAQSAIIDPATGVSVPAQSEPEVIYPVIYEILGNTATLLVEGAGEVTARAGMSLPGGFRVMSVGNGGVIVEHDGEQVALGFGTSLPQRERSEQMNPMPAMPLF